MAEFNDREMRRPRAQVVFLVDSAEYQGVSREFEVVETVVTKYLRLDQTLQEHLTGETAFCKAVERLFARFLRLEVVIAGWIDQAVLECHRSLRGDERCWSKMLGQLDDYRPAENGDLWFYLADFGYNQVLATVFSFERNSVRTNLYRRVVRGPRGC